MYSMKREEGQRQWTPVLQSVFRIDPFYSTSVPIFQVQARITCAIYYALISPVFHYFLLILLHSLSPSSMHLTIRLIISLIRMFRLSFKVFPPVQIYILMLVHECFTLNQNGQCPRKVSGHFPSPCLDYALPFGRIPTTP